MCRKPALAQYGTCLLNASLASLQVFHENIFNSSSHNKRAVYMEELDSCAVQMSMHLSLSLISMLPGSSLSASWNAVTAYLCFCKSRWVIIAVLYRSKIRSCNVGSRHRDPCFSTARLYVYCTSKGSSPSRWRPVTLRVHYRSHLLP